ncbi:MAG: hypothetical protein HYZ66_09180 [Chlamydiae bacterium]|nr:hypothetical protein [Chlamydiota bacterium]
MRIETSQKGPSAALAASLSRATYGKMYVSSNARSALPSGTFLRGFQSFKVSNYTR